MKIKLSLVALTTLMFSVTAFAGGNAAEGQKKSAVCAGCHGADGNSIIGANPRLAGQYKSYLYQALKQYKTGARKDMLMGSMVANLSDDDLQDLAAWFSSQDGKTLQVLPK